MIYITVIIACYSLRSEQPVFFTANLYFRHEAARFHCVIPNQQVSKFNVVLILLLWLTWKVSIVNFGALNF